MSESSALDRCKCGYQISLICIQSTCRSDVVLEDQIVVTIRLHVFTI